MDQNNELLEFIKRLGPNFWNRIKDILNIFFEIDGDATRFGNESGLRCESGCGRCCMNPKVEATVLEMLPAAFELARLKKSKDLFPLLLEESFSQYCVLFQPNALVEGHGRCSMYAHRPSICRLFGFSAMTRKDGQPALVTCPTIKNTHAKEFSKAEKQLREGSLKAPLMAEYSMKISAIDPHLSRERLPINQALRQALEKVETILGYANPE